MTDRQQLIRERAYRIWQQAGEPDGAPNDQWHQAEREIESETGALGSDEDANLDAERKAAVDAQTDDSEP